MRSRLIIAIDGPAGAGKSTVARRLARRLGLSEQKDPDKVEADIRQRLDALTAGGTIPVDEMSPAQLKALEGLQDYERRVGVKDFELAVSIFDPVEESIEEEMYARRVN